MEPWVMELLHEFVEQRDDIADPRLIDTRKPCTWSDELFMSKCFEPSKLMQRVPLSGSLLSAKVFLGFYAFNQWPLKLKDLLLSILCNMTTSHGEFLISNDCFTESAYRTVRAPGETVTMVEQGQWELGVRNNHLPLSIDNRKANEWYQSLFKALGEMDIQNKNQPSQKAQLALNYVGFIVLQLLRTCAKNRNTVSLHIAEYNKSTFQKLWKEDLGFEFTLPPHNTSLNKFAERFERLASRCVVTLSLIVYSHIKAKETVKDEIQEIFREGLLDALSKVGLGCLDWLQRASAKLNIKETELMSYTGLKRCEDINEALTNFFEEHGNQKTMPWARLFAQYALMQLSIATNPTFAGILLAITVDGNAFDSNWNMPQIKKHINPMLKQKCIEAAKKFVEDYQRAKSVQK